MSKQKKSEMKQISSKSHALSAANSKMENKMKESKDNIKPPLTKENTKELNDDPTTTFNDQDEDKLEN